MLRALLVSAAALLCVGLVTSTNTFAQGDKKGDAGKSKDDSKSKDDGKAKPPDKMAEPGKDPIKPKTPLEQIRLPNNAIIVVVDDLLKASAMIPKQWIVPLEEWLALQERVKVLENQLKGERVLPSSCKLVGELKDDFLVFRGEYVFATGAGKSTVPLGLQGGHLIKEGRLNKQPAILEIDKEDGLLARIDKEGNPHRLIVEFRVPVKKAPGAGLDRSIDLGLPQSAGTVLELTLPGGVRELRWNGNTEKPIAPGRWQIGLERSKTLNLAWKEPLPPSVNAPLAKVESQVRVDIDASHVNVSADLFMEDRRLRTEEWHIHLPALAKVETVKAPAGLTYTLDEKMGLAVLRVPVSSDRWQVTLTQRVPRPTGAAKVPIGPFVVHSAFQVQGIQQISAALENHGTITVKMPADSSLGQRLVFTRAALVNQTKNSDTEAAFQYVMPAPPEKAAKLPVPKAPLELEWRFDKNQLRTRVEHDVNIQSGSQAYELETTTRITVTALFATINAVDLKLPPLRPHGMQLIGAAAPGLSFPGALPWGGIWNTQDSLWPYRGPDDFQIADDAGSDFKFQLLDATGKSRVTWTRGAAKEVTLILKSTVRVSPQTRRVRLDLPRPLGTQDRGAKLVLQTDDRLELLHGAPGSEDATPNRHRFDMTWDQSPLTADVSWRPFQRDIVTKSTLDVDVHEFSAQITQILSFPRDRLPTALDAKNAQIHLKAPRGIDKVTLLSEGGEITHDRARGLIYYRPIQGADDHVELTLQYFVPITQRTLHVPAVWPTHGSHEDVKVRIWTKPGVSVRLLPDLIQRGLWKEGSIELVRDRDELPALVLVSLGTKHPLSLTLEDVGGTALAALVAERALIQARMGEDGSQTIHARYYVTKVNAPSVDVELPIPLSRFRDPPAFYWGNLQLTQMKKLDAAEKILRLQLPAAAGRTPAILKIIYTIPPEALERSSAWATTLHAPLLRSDSLIEQTRWQLSMPAALIAASLGRHARAEIDWSLQGWLPTPEATTADWDAWLHGRDANGPGAMVTFAFSGSNGPAELVYHLPRSWWLLGCSGLFLILALGVYFSPLPRWAYWFFLGVLSLALAAFTIVYPAAWAAAAFGLQPGIVLFLVFVGIHQLVQERYRRQLVFMPGFTRTKAGSTISRTNSAKVLREASTVDAPPGAAEEAANSPSTPSGT